MPVIHKNLPDAELHESKGVAGAPANQVYVTDGAGSGAFKAYGALPSALTSASVGSVIVSDGAGGVTVQPYDKEPKGIVSALADQVYVADGAGSGLWKDLAAPPTVVPPTFASLIAQGTSSITLAAATDTTLQTNSNYTPLNNTNMWATEVAYGSITASPSSGEIVITTAGYYQVCLSGILTDSATNAKVGIIFGDGTTFKLNRSIRTMPATGTTIAVRSIVQLAANEAIAPYIASDIADTITTNSITFAVMRIA